jgi:hypothetical protein
MRDYLKFGLLNLGKLFQKYTGFMVLLLLVEMITAMAIYFSYGVYANYEYEKNDNILGSRSMTILFLGEQEDGEKTAIPLYRFTEIQEQLEKAVGSALVSIRIETFDADQRIYVYGVCEKQLAEYEFLDQTARQILENGRYFTEAEEEQGANVCLTYWPDQRALQYYGRTYEAVGTLLNWYGVDYEEKLTAGGWDAYFVPYNSLPAESLVDTVEILVDRMVSERMEDSVKTLLDQYFSGEYEYIGPDEVSEVKLETSAAVVLMIVIMAVLAAVNQYMTYDYLFRCRKRMMAAARICGGIRGKLFVSHLTEIFSVALLGTICAWGLYAGVLEKALNQNFVYFDEIYTTQVYVMITGIYLGILLIVSAGMSLRYVLKTPLTLLRS